MEPFVEFWKRRENTGNAMNGESKRRVASEGARGKTGQLHV